MRHAPVIVMSTDADTQDMYVYALRARRRRVYGTSSVDETITLTQDGGAAAIVLDARQRDDFVQCRRLRRHRVTSLVPIVVVSSYVTEDGRYRRLATRLGCAAFLAKPSTPSTVDGVVTRVIRGERGIDVETHDGTR